MAKLKGRAPSCKAAILCDQAIRDAGTQKWTLVGLWDRIQISKEPSKDAPIFHNQIGLYFYLVDTSVGEFPWMIELLHFGDLIECDFELKGKVVVKDELLPLELGVNFRRVPIKAVGSYTFRLWINGKAVGDKDFKVVINKGGK